MAVNFACIADAVAHYYNAGFTSSLGQWTGDIRVMENVQTRQGVRIRKVGFLDVEAVTYPIEPNICWRVDNNGRQYYEVKR